MTPRLGTRSVMALLPAALLLVPTAAQAEKVVTEDAAGDTVVVGFVADDDAELPPPPDPSPADIIRTVGAHGENRLAVTVHFSELAGVREHSTRLLVRTGAGEFHLQVRAKEGRRTATELVGPEGAIDCRALRARLDRSEDLLAVSVPTTCLSSPRWVELGVMAFSPLPMSDPAVLASAVDDGHRETVSPRRAATGPRIRRG
ncbi:hypothetical protein GCM10023339_43840 [Alloalcanivorax gelatiniphagus]